MQGSRDKVQGSKQKLQGIDTYIVIAPDGKIIEHKLGFTKGSFKSLTKALTK